MLVRAQRTAARLLQSPLFVVGILTLVAAALRIYHLSFKSLWLDEAQLYSITTGSLFEVLAKNGVRNSAPFLFPVLVSFVSHFRDSENALRLISCAAGIAAVPAMYMLATRFVSKYAACFAALLAALSTAQITYSQQVREYALTFLFAVLILIGFSSFLARPNWRNTLTLALLLVLGILTQYGITLLTAALNLVFLLYLLKFRNRHALFKWVVVQSFALVAVSLVVVVSLRTQWVPQGFAAESYLQSAYWDRTLPGFYTLAVTHTADIFNFAFEGALALFLCVLGVLTVLVERRKRLFLALFVTMFGITFAASLVRFYPYQGARHTIFLTPVVYLAIAFGFDTFVKNRQRLAAVALVAVLVFTQLPSVFAYLNNPGGENIRPLVDTLRESLQPGDRIYVYYYSTPAFSYYWRKQDTPSITSVISQTDPQAYYAQVDELTAQPGRIWMLFSHCVFQAECHLIATHASTRRPLELVDSDVDALLYLLH
ncbi:MAG: glycosyltransferase family 39 protein [Chloroflexota bacterium]